MMNPYNCINLSTAASEHPAKFIKGIWGIIDNLLMVCVQLIPLYVENMQKKIARLVNKNAVICRLSVNQTAKPRTSQ